MTTFEKKKHFRSGLLACEGSNQQNFNMKRVRVVCYLEQKTNPNRNIQNNSKQTQQTNRCKQNTKG